MAFPRRLLLRRLPSMNVPDLRDLPLIVLSIEALVKGALLFYADAHEMVNSHVTSQWRGC